MADYLNIAGRIRTTASDGVAMEAQEVKDLNLNKSQQEINADVQTELGDRYTKEETYSKEQLDNLITTPDENHVSVVATNATTAVTDILPATGEANTIYRVGNWNGTQYDPAMYALFAWNGTAYVCLAVRSFVGEVYDISVNHPDGQGNPTPYTDLAAALGTDGANIPVDIRRGGMSIKFIQGTVQSSDNKYVQYFLTKNEWSINVNDWEKINLKEEILHVDRKYIKLKSAWTINASEVTHGDYYVNGAGALMRRNDTGTDSTIIEQSEEQIFLFEDFLFRIKTGYNDVKYAMPINNVYILSGFMSIPSAPQRMQYYLSASNELRFISAVSGSGTISEYAKITLTKDMLFIYDNNIYLYDGSNIVPKTKIVNDLTTGGVSDSLSAEMGKELKNTITDVDRKYIKLKSAWGLNVANITYGDYYITEAGVLMRRNDSGSGSTIILQTSEQVFIYDDFIFLVKTGTNDVPFARPANNIYILSGMGAIPASPAKMQYYYTASGELRFISAVSGSGTIGAYSIIPLDKNMLFIYDNVIYVYDGTKLVQAIDPAIINSKTIELKGYHTAPTDEIAAVGDYYYSSSNQLRKIKSFRNGTPYTWDVVTPSRDAVYLCNGEVFIYNGNSIVLSVADTYKHYLEVSTIILPNNNTPAAGIDDTVSLVCCAVKYDNSRTPANGYGNNSHPIPIGWLYYDWKDKDKIYYSASVADKPQFLFTWKRTIPGSDTNNGIAAYSVAICPNGDIVCVPSAQIRANRDYNPIIYRHEDYDNPVEVNVNVENSAGVAVKPVGWFGSAGAEVLTIQNCLIFGEYARPAVEPANLWKVVYPFDNPDSWSIVYGTTGTGEGTREIEHFHSVNLDVFTSRLYAGTGDLGNESYIMESVDNGETWTKVFGGTDAERNRARCLNMIFTKDACYYGSDNTPALVKVLRDNNGILDFTTTAIHVDKNGNATFPVITGYSAGSTYYTCLIDEPFGLLLLQYRESVNTNGIIIYFYDIENDILSIVGKFKPIGQSQIGFRCDGLNYYQSRCEKRIVAGYEKISNYGDWAGNKGREYGNLTLRVF